MITFRLGLFQMDEKHAKELVEAIKRQPGSCDIVWLTAMGCYPSLERHVQYAEGWIKAAQIFRDAGLRVSMQIANTIGHGDFSYAAPENGGEFGKGMMNTEDDPFMVGPTGVKNKSCFCWNSTSLRQYIKSVVQIYCERLHLDRLWFDDDLRAHHHRPSSHGCYCDRCISKFNAQYGTAFDRDTLVHEMNYGDTVWRKNYIDFCRQSIYEFTYEVACAAVEVSDGLSFGLEYEHGGNYVGTDDIHILKALYDASGGKPVETRPGGGFYHDKDPWFQYVKGLGLAVANSSTPDYVQAKVAEIEDLPGTAYGKSIGGIVNEGTIELAMGCTGLSFTDVQSLHEPMSYYEKIFKRISEIRPYWERLSEISKTCCCGGVGIFMGEQPHLRALSQNDEPFLWDTYIKEDSINWLKIGIPLTYDMRQPAAYILNHRWVNSLTDEDIRFLLTKPVVADGESINQLCRRGFSSYFPFTLEPVGNDTMEIFTEHPVNGRKSGFFYNENPYASVPMQRYVFRDLDQNSEVIGEMYNSHFITDEAWLGSCSLITKIQNENGTRPVKWMISGYSLWNDKMSSGKRNQLVGALDAITGMPVRLLNEESAVVVPSLDGEGKTVSVTIAAASQSGTEEIELVVRNPRGLCVDAMATRHSTLPVKIADYGDNEITITVSSLDPYEVVTVFFC